MRKVHSISSVCHPEEAQVIRKAKDLPTKDLCTRFSALKPQAKSSGSDSGRPLLPADCFFDLPRLDAILGSEMVYRFKRDCLIFAVLTNPLPNREKRASRCRGLCS